MIVLLLACEVVKVSHPYTDPEGWTITVEPCGLILLLIVTTALAPWRPRESE